MKSTKTFCILAVLLIAGSISVYAGGASETAQDVLDILRDATQGTGVPGAPTGVTAARNPAGSTNVLVRWNAVSGATSYKVYFSRTNSGSGTEDGETTTTSFTGEGYNTDRIYYFRVSAVNSAGEGAPSSWVELGSGSGTGGGTARVPGAPTGVTAARNPAGSTNIRVSWNAVSGATSYRVYWSNTNSGSGYLEGEPTTTSFTSEDNQTNETHYFRVTAVNAAGEGAASSWISVGPATASGTPAQSGGPTNWRAVANSRIDSINDVAYGGGRFVAVGADGKMAYSADGATWTAVVRSPFGTTRVSAIAYGNGRFVAGGWDNTIAYSTDGITWTRAANTEIGYDGIYGIAYGNNRFVAVSFHGEMAYSTDGVRWTTVANSPFPSSSNVLTAIAYGGNRFIAGGDKGKMAYSTDGARWTTVTVSSFSDNAVTAIAYGGNRFVAGGSDGKMAYSTDGTRWTAVADSKFGRADSINAIAWGNNRFVAVGYHGNWDAPVMAYSTDGTTWTAIANSGFPADRGIFAIAYGNGRFVAGGGGSRIAYCDW